MIDPKDIPLSEVLDGALEYMEGTKAAALRGGGYPLDLERCLQFQKEALARPAQVTVSDEMVEKACAAHWNTYANQERNAWHMPSIKEEWRLSHRKQMRAALEAAMGVRP